jgi:hypothetical protein
MATRRSLRETLWLGLGLPDYPTPDFIYAATPGDEENNGASNRPAETVAPPGEKLAKRVKVNTKYTLRQEAALMKEVLGLSGNVLICWDHHAIIGGILPEIPAVEGKLQHMAPGTLTRIFPTKR